MTGLGGGFCSVISQGMFVSGSGMPTSNTIHSHRRCICVGANTTEPVRLTGSVVFAPTNSKFKISIRFLKFQFKIQNFNANFNAIFKIKIFNSTFKSILKIIRF